MHSAFIAAAVLAAVPTVAFAESDVTLAPFHAVGLSDGGEVVVRYGAQQRVHVIEGDEQNTRFTVRKGSLEIANCYSMDHCPHDYHLRVEITVPVLTALAVSDGGHLRAEGAFPAQQTIAAAVHDGGVVDMRAVKGGEVTAAVNSGGRVTVTAVRTLIAAVNFGGVITYWGDPESVTKAIHDGGAIRRGDGAREHAAHTRVYVDDNDDSHDD